MNGGRADRKVVVLGGSGHLLLRMEKRTKLQGSVLLKCRMVAFLYLEEVMVARLSLHTKNGGLVTPD